MKTSINVLIIAAVLGLSAMTSYAEEMAMPEMAQSGSQQSIAATGTVMANNKDDGIVTIRHQAIQAIGWPPMTMKFKVTEKMLLDKVNKGDKVQFSLVQQGKDYVINQINNQQVRN